MHGECKLLERLSYLSGCGLPTDSQQTVVVLALCQNWRQQDEENPHHQYNLDVMGPLNPEDNLVAHH